MMKGTELSGFFRLYTPSSQNEFRISKFATHAGRASTKFTVGSSLESISFWLIPQGGHNICARWRRNPVETYEKLGF